MLQCSGDRPASVGEAISLPRGRSNKLQKWQANSYQFPTFVPFIQTLRRISWREDDILPYSGLAIILLRRNVTGRCPGVPDANTPGAPLSAGTARQTTIYPLAELIRYALNDILYV